jgi:hypothetical protein
MKDTITESELTAIGRKFRNDPRAMDTEGIMRFALSEVGITVVPDPTPEPEGDVIVVDKDGDAWLRTGSGWLNERTEIQPWEWENVISEYGPVKIYRAEES